MRQTLFHIPHEVFGLPLLGFGVALAVWLLFCVGLLLWLVRRQGWNSDTMSYLPLMIIVSVAIAIVLPWLEATDVEGQRIGLPIRGYGMLVLMGIICGVGLAAYQARRMGMDPEVIFSLAMWMTVGAVSAARLFYVIQYSDQFLADSLTGTLKNVVNLTEGGLVVYGSVMGGLIAFVIFTRVRKLPALAIGDLIAPSMLLGLALGRIGCLMNGCCYGGLCETDRFCVTFPLASPPYLQQLREGVLLGLEFDDPYTDKPVIVRVDPGSRSDEMGLKKDDRIDKWIATEKQMRMAQRNDEQNTLLVGLTTADGNSASWTLQQLPERSQPVHPTQVYSAVNAILVCGVLWFFYPLRRRDGEVFALMFTLYPIARFVLEMIRNDESGLGSTPFTISQWISLAMLAGATLFWIYLSRQPQGSVLPRSAESSGAA